MRFLSFILPLSIIVIVPSIIMCIRVEFFLVGTIDLISFLTIVIISFKKNISLKNRKIIFVGVIYLLSAILLVNMGLQGPGFIYLLGLSLIITLIIGSKAGFYSVIFNLFISLIYCFGSYFKWFALFGYHSSSLESNLVIGLNFLIVNIFSVLAIASLLKGLERTLIEDRYLKQKAQESDNLKSAFLANISHEIRTPLNAIMGFSQLAFDSDYCDSEKKQFIKTVTSSSEQLLTMINSIVDISVIESGQLKLDYSTFELSETMDDCLHQMKSMADSKNIEILKEEDEKVSVYADRSKLAQVIINLLNNAIKFTDEGTVTFGYRIESDFIKFKISDSGKGIPSEIGNNLFQRFYKVENHEYKSGAGLGLAISKGIIDALNGEIWYESNVGVGTDFFFTIPLYKDIGKKI